jgi:response regulator RpfG family c-di-GMP phosphodiesterase
VPFEGNKEEQIPLEARIFQVVETWDLMRIDLPDWKALNEMDVLEYIQSQAGKRFDPRFVENFIVMIKTQY